MITKITCTAIMTALAVVLMYLEIPLPFMPPFLKFDFSEVPVLIGSFALGPIHLPATGTMGIGEASNFLTGSIYVFTAGSIYKKIKTRKGAVISMLVATLALAVIACPLNFFVTLPLYGKVLNFPTEAIVAMSNAVNPLITTKNSLILWGFLPFNLFKGTVVSFITFWVYKPISNLINRIANQTQK